MYEVQATYLELLAASPICISLICFVLQEAQEHQEDSPGAKKCKNAPRNLLGEPAFQQTYRTAARGNASMFLMPLADILAELTRLETASAVSLPRSAHEIKNVVKVILKSQGQLPDALITAATIRREVVVTLIAEQKARGHPMYKDLDMTQVRQKAAREFPIQGSLPNHAQSIGHDNSLDRIEMQKCASPSPIASSVSSVFDTVRPFCVVQEKSGSAERDEVELQTSTWESLAQRVFGKEITIETGRLGHARDFCERHARKISSVCA